MRAKCRYNIRRNKNNAFCYRKVRPTEMKELNKITL